MPIDSMQQLDYDDDVLKVNFTLKNNSVAHVS